MEKIYFLSNNRKSNNNESTDTEIEKINTNSLRA